MSKHTFGDGYFTGIDYTTHYFRDLSPLRAEFALLADGLDTPPPGPCCELGFGRGLSLAMHAAADPDRPWWGTDLMASHVHHAQQLVDAAGVTANLAAQSFAEFCVRDDLPQFAFIGLHGVWSWVTAANRDLIAGFLKRRLLPGGAVYISYNTLPGWTQLLPMRSLMVEHEYALGAAATAPAERMRAATAFISQVLAVDGPVARQLPGLRKAFEREQAKEPEYLLHEYMNGDWHHSSLGELARQLEPAQLSWATSSELLQRLPAIYLTPEQQKLLAAVPGVALRESVRDLFVGQGLRRDLFVRGPHRLTQPEQRERLHAQWVVLLQHPSQVAGKIIGPLAEAALPPKTLRAIVDALAGVESAMSIGALCQRLQAQGIDETETLAQVITLVGSGTLDVAVDPARSACARPATERMNAELLRRAAVRHDVQCLASPVTAGGVAASVMQQKMLAVSQAHPGQPALWAEQLGTVLQRSGQQLQKDGRMLTTAAEMKPLLDTALERFRTIELPVLQRLQVA